MSNIFDFYKNPKNPGAYSGLSGCAKNNKQSKKDDIKKELLKTKATT